MEASKFTKFIKILSEKIEKKELEWVQESNYEFRTLVGKNMIAVGVRPADSEYDTEDYYVSIYDHLGINFLDSVTDVDLKRELDGSFTLMKNLYRMARHKALDLDGILDNLIDELEDPL
jgi:hypothetical protein